MMRTTLLLALATVLALPAQVRATDHEPPRTVLHAPRGQVQRAGISGYEWWPHTPSETDCPRGPQPHADVFGSPKKRVEVRAGAPLFVRFHTPRQPESVTIRSSTMSGPIPSTLVPHHSPEGTVVAWDVRFETPRFRRRDRSAMWADGRWMDVNCPDYRQWATWNFSLKRRI